MSTTFDRISLSIDSVAHIEEEVKTNVDHLYRFKGPYPEGKDSKMSSS